MEETGSPDMAGVLMVSMIGLFLLAFGSTIIFVVYQRRMLEKDRRMQERESQYQKELLQAIIKSQEEERKRIAHDLHDEIGVLLTTSRIYFNQLSPGNAEEHLVQISEKMNKLFDEMMFNIRRISHDLRPVILEKLGLVEAVESLSRKLSEAGLQFDFYHYLPLTLSEDAELLLYRIIQELLSNTLKHARAQAIEINMEVKSDFLYLSYRDDGIGMLSSDKKGLGMKSIESRLSIMDGKMENRSSEKGVYFFIKINCNKVQQHE